MGFGLPKRSEVVKKSFTDVGLSIQTFVHGLLRNMEPSIMCSSPAMVQVFKDLLHFGSLL